MAEEAKSYTVQRVMRALVYIQEHLDEEIQLEDVARAA